MVESIAPVIFARDSIGITSVTSSPHAEPGETEEEVANNLSYPVIFTAEPLILGGTAGEYSFEGQYWLGGISTVTGEPITWNSSEPTPEEVDESSIYRIYLQKDPFNLWQAGSIANNGLTIANYIDVGDNLENHTFGTNGMVRIEFTPYATLAETLTGFEMALVSGHGEDEVWGAKATNPGNSSLATAVTYDSPFASIHSDRAFLNISKLEAGIEQPDGKYFWNPFRGTWIGVAQTASNETLSSEINVQGKLIYGDTWSPSSGMIDEGVTQEGWWRLTFYTDAGNSLTPRIDPIVDFQRTTQIGAPELPVPTALMSSEGEESEDPLYRLVVDPIRDIAYIDIYIKSCNGNGGGGGGGHSGGGGEHPDALVGTSGQSSIVGGSESDYNFVTDSSDRDFLSGSSNADVFLLSAGEGTDTITNFEPGVDFIGLASELREKVSIGVSGRDATVNYGDEILAIVTGAATLIDPVSDILTL